MDIDFWTSRIHSAKQLSAAHASRHHPAAPMDDSDGDEDARACFPCPFCYVDIEVNVLCSHLQDEHCFVLKKCANLGKDAIGHFIVQHASSLKILKEATKMNLLTTSPYILINQKVMGGCYLMEEMRWTVRREGRRQHLCNS